MPADFQPRLRDGGTWDTAAAVDVLAAAITITGLAHVLARVRPAREVSDSAPAIVGGGDDRPLVGPTSDSRASR